MEDVIQSQDRRSPTLENASIGMQPSLEVRISTLDSCMHHYFDDQRRIAETLKRIEVGLRTLKPVPSGHTLWKHTHKHGNTDTHVTEGTKGHSGRTNRIIPPITGPFLVHDIATRTDNSPEFGRPWITAYNVRFDYTCSASPEFIPFAGPKTHRTELTRSYPASPLNTCLKKCLWIFGTYSIRGLAHHTCFATRVFRNESRGPRVVFGKTRIDSFTG